MSEKSGAINIVFDGPPGPVAGRFVEVETDDGRSIGIGEWIQKGEFWLLRITDDDMRAAVMRADGGDPYEGMEDPAIVRAWIAGLDRQQARISESSEDFSVRLDRCEQKISALLTSRGVEEN